MSGLKKVLAIGPSRLRGNIMSMAMMIKTILSSTSTYRSPKDTVPISAPETTPNIQETPTPQPHVPKSRPRIIYPPASRQSSRLASLNQPTEDPENIPEIPILPDDEDDEEFGSATALTAGTNPEPVAEPLNRFIPQTFREAFDISRRHLWYPTMVKEIDRWDERGVVTPRTPP